MTKTTEKFCLHPPFIISSYLLPAVQIAEVTISMKTLRYHSGRKRFQYEYIIEHKDWIHTGYDIFMHKNDLEEAFVTLLHFLCTAAEAYNYGSRSDNFPLFVSEWAQQNSDELSLLAYEIGGEA